MLPRMSDGENRLLDENQWKNEAQAVINDVKRHVRDIGLSEKLRSTNSFIYLNLTTLEGFKYCVELSGAGFTIVGNQHDDTSNRGNERFETPYSLLNYVSPLYENSFGNLLFDKLKELADKE
ncbi:GSK3-beta interaction protein [Cephus cinctus]|uniref:GSK3-beta interaction protein n=1 Tax=Cephus cinctus TaxID=211228 RepID=A0AAJ7RCL1_CEPCN|nr:GSK3-beta interaction protein [Cephus cinctus]